MEIIFEKSFTPAKPKVILEMSSIKNPYVRVLDKR